MTKPTWWWLGTVWSATIFLKTASTAICISNTRLSSLAKSVMPLTTAYISQSILPQRGVLSLVEGDFFARHGIELRLSQQIVAIDRDAHVVRTASGHETHWDKLVLATGSYPFAPPVPGNTLPGCFVYRTLDDPITLPRMRRIPTRRSHRRWPARAGAANASNSWG